MPSPSKRLVLFFDGTDNTPADRTNVWRAQELLAERDAEGVVQIKRYIQGVGTDFGQGVRGSIFGVGVANRIREGYTWLAENYEPGTEIYVFGFSRGAFTARSLVQMIASCGLTQKQALTEWTANRAFAHYESISRGEANPIWRLKHWQKHPDEIPQDWVPTSEDALLLADTRVRVVKVKMAGLWDTVGAMGADALTNQGALTQKSAEHNVRPTKAQEYGYHAIAIDEHRPMFDVTLWRTFVPEGELAATAARFAPYYEQRWFVGAHSDVGGGYHDDDLPDVSLSWMLKKATALGLAFTNAIEPQPNGWHGQVHDSFQTFAGGILNIWAKILPGDQRHYREIGRSPRPVTAENGMHGELCSINETIDESVYRRWQSSTTYRPPGLVDFFRRNPLQRPPGV